MLSPKASGFPIPRDVCNGIQISSSSTIFSSFYFLHCYDQHFHGRHRVPRPALDSRFRRMSYAEQPKIEVFIEGSCIRVEICQDGEQTLLQSYIISKSRQSPLAVDAKHRADGLQAIDTAPVSTKTHLHASLLAVISLTGSHNQLPYSHVGCAIDLHYFIP